MQINRPDHQFATSFGTYLGVSCLLVGWAALVASYLFGGPAWELKHATYGQSNTLPLGVVNEATRLLLVVCLAFGTLCTGFSREVYWLFTPIAASQEAAEDSPELSRRYRRFWVNVFRVVIVLTMVIMTVREARSSFDSSKDGLPAKLVIWGLQPAPPEANMQHLAYSSEQADDFRAMLRQARRAYAWYLPYTLVNFAIIFPLVLWVPLFAVFTAERFLLRIAAGGPAETSSVKETKAAMVDFRYACYRSAMRFLNLFAAISLVFVYLQFDQGITDEVRRQLQIMFCLLSVATGLFFVRIWVVYHNYWQVASHYVLAQDDTQQDFVDKNSPLQFFQSLFRQPLPGFAIAGLAATLLREYLPFDLLG